MILHMQDKGPSRAVGLDDLPVHQNRLRANENCHIPVVLKRTRRLSTAARSPFVQYLDESVPRNEPSASKESQRIKPANQTLHPSLRKHVARALRFDPCVQAIPEYAIFSKSWLCISFASLAIFEGTMNQQSIHCTMVIT